MPAVSGVGALCAAALAIVGNLATSSISASWTEANSPVLWATTVALSLLTIALAVRSSPEQRPTLTPRSSESDAYHLPPTFPPTGGRPRTLHGRRALLDNLLSGQAVSSHHFVVLAGHGGVGKSAIALEIASKFVATGRQTWWVDGRDVQWMSEILLDIAHQDLALSRDDYLAAKKVGARAADIFWQQLNQRDGWLIVFDNVDDPTVFADEANSVGVNGRGWIRPSSQGLVIITSRASQPAQWGSDAHIIPILDLAPQDGALVLLDLASNAGSPEDAEWLSQRLGGLPLALQQAGMYLANPFAVYRRFKDYSIALLVSDPKIPGDGSDARRLVAATWDISVKLLERQGHRHLSRYLELLSAFAPGAPIPVTIFESMRMKDLFGRRWSGFGMHLKHSQVKA
jgi:hypothetical protein